MAILINNKKQSERVSKEHNYSEFWIGRGMANVEYGGSGAGTTVKALKLRNYQRAIGNFVKILSAKDWILMILKLSLRSLGNLKPKTQPKKTMGRQEQSPPVAKARANL